MRFSTRRTTPRTAFAFLILLTSTGVFADSEAGSCSGDDVSLNQWLAAPLAEPPRDAANRHIVEQPLGAPDATQMSAVSASGDAMSLVSGAGVPTLLAFAAETGLASTSDGKITINLSPFDLVAAVNPVVVDRQSTYEQYGRARRFGLALTLGGTGESFDRDGDGEADEALEAKNLGDIVSWEARYRVLGSRDRREKANYTRVFAVADSSFLLEQEAYQSLMSSVAEYVFAHHAEVVSRSRSDCYSREALDEALLNDPNVASLKRAYDTAHQALPDAVADVDRAFLLTLFAGGLSRADDFGPDQRRAGVRAAWGGEDRNLTLNLEWNETESGAGEKPTTWKAGLEYAVLLFKGGAYKDGIQVAGSGVYEKYENVPLAKHDTVARLGAKLELPVGVGVKIPISVTWANHPDLIEGESEIRGHIGFTFDLSQIKKPTSQ